MTTTFETAKVGDKVWGVENGWGEIQSINVSDNYPIRVIWGNYSNTTYTLEGKRAIAHNHQSLFWDEIEIKAPTKPMPSLEVDTKVLVWNDPKRKHNRHFSHFSDGLIYTFEGGCTSFTAMHEDDIISWKGWEVFE
ncbi:MAG: hypothetical protein KIG95_03470 [Comamonas sp.]|nr:hypothetical protein [Comamonas sp.]